MCAQIINTIRTKTTSTQESFDRIVGTGPFSAMSDFQSKLKHYERVTGTSYYIRSTYSIERRAKITGSTIPKAMGYYWIRYLCVHNCRPMQPNTKKRRVQDFSCPSEISLVYDEDLKGLRITSKNLKHNHPTAPSFPERYSMNRRLTGEQEEVMFTLLDSFQSISQLKEYAETMFQIRLTSDNIRRLCDRHKKRQLSECEWECNNQSSTTPSDTSTNNTTTLSSESKDNRNEILSQDHPAGEFDKEYFARRLTSRLYDALIKLDGQDFEKLYFCVESVLQQCTAPAEPPAPALSPSALTSKKPKPPASRRTTRARQPLFPQVLKPMENMNRFRPILPKVPPGASTLILPSKT